jgi:peptidoglycan hydrolase FlgJ
MTDPLDKIYNYSTLPPIQHASQGARNKPSDPELKEACHQFESLFVKYMLQTMRNTFPENNLFGGGQAEKIYTGMLDDEVARSVSQQRGIGLAAMMYAQMASMGDKDNNGK